MTTLRTERAVNDAVIHLNESKLEILKRWGRKALLTTASAISLVAGMAGTAQQMQAQNRQAIEISVNGVNTPLRLDNGSTVLEGQEEYAQIYENRDNYYRQQRQAPYGSAQWLEENGLEYDARLSRHVNRHDFLGAFIDWNNVDRYGMPTHVVYLSRDPIHKDSVRVTRENAKQMAEHPGGDALGIYNARGADLNNPENNPSWGGYDGGYYDGPCGGGKAERVVRTVGAAARTAHNLYHILKGHGR